MDTTIISEALPCKDLIADADLLVKDNAFFDLVTFADQWESQWKNKGNQMLMITPRLMKLSEIYTSTHVRKIANRSCGNSFLENIFVVALGLSANLK
jgi:hypothetical protein